MNAVEFNKYKDLCVQDMCAHLGVSASGQRPVCLWVAALARACKELDPSIIVDWHSDAQYAACMGKLIGCMYRVGNGVFRHGVNVIEM